MTKYCIELGCNKQPSFNYPEEKKPITCREHHLYGMVNVREYKRCPCGKFTHHCDYCISCYNEQNGIVRNKGENMLKNYLKERFPQLCLKTEFKICNYKIDFLLELVELFIVIEHDEKQHKDKWKYPVEREAQREKKIFEKLSEKKRTVLIRFNPSSSKLQKTPLEQRLEKLGEFIEECISDETKSGIFKLFYDE